MSKTLFRSFFMGGFECSTHRDNLGRRLDLIASTRHDELAERDYTRLLEVGIAAARDGVRWHLIEKEPFKYDFESLERQASAAKSTGIEVAWDLFHYGFPDDLDIFSERFLERFESFSAETARYLKDKVGGTLYVCPVNEISFFSWIAGDVAGFYPAQRKRGNELKRQLVRAAVRATDAVRGVAPDTRILHTDPAIHVVPRNATPQAKRAAEAYRQAQFDGFDMLAGRKVPELGGGPDYLDIIGLNYYFHNQWRHPSRRKIAVGHKEYRPFRSILHEFALRYGRPILIAETGIEDEARPEWLRYVSEQTRQAIAKDALTIEGMCLYPIVNHPGWKDDRHCHNGLWDYADEHGDREIYQPLAEELARQAELFESALERREAANTA
jgi:beta-glucosidase/6-phospho-beta-glucosidase/beta-galactosidase